MKKRLLAVFIVFCMAIVVFCGCAKENKTTLQEEIKKQKVSEGRLFDFETDTCGWQTYANGQNDIAAHYDEGKTGLPCIALIGADLDVKDNEINAAMFNKFFIGKDDKNLVISVNIIKDLPTNFGVMIVCDGKTESVFPTNATIKSNEGYIKLDGKSQTLFVYDLTKYVGKIVSIIIVNDSISPNGSEGVYVNSVSICKNYSDITTLDKWDSQQIASDWQLRGNVVATQDCVLLSNAGKSASINNRTHVLSTKPFLRVLVKANSSTTPKLVLFVNGNGIANQEGSLYSGGKTSNYCEYIYDLSQYADTINDLEFASMNDAEVAIKEIYFDNVVPGKTNFSVWDIESIYSDWSKSGVVAKHSEGVCLENAAAPASISKSMVITESTAYLAISFRKFVREVKQDKDPEIRVYVNDQLVKCVSGSEFVTTTSDEYSQYTFNLSGFCGNVITVKIVNESGEHACFNSICLFQISY